MGLGHALRVEGRHERAALEFQAARTTFERVGAMSQAARAAAVLGDAPQPPVGLPPVVGRCPSPS